MPPETPIQPPAPANKRILLIGGVSLVAVVVLAVAGWYIFLGKSETPKIYHVGVLNALDYFGPVVDGFKKKMTELGYVEGKNIMYDVQKGPAPVGNQLILQKFVQDKVDLILAFPTEATIEAKEVTKGTGISVVATNAVFEGNDIAETLQRPGANITGVRFPLSEVTTRRLEILHELAPKATHIMIPYLKDYPTVAPAFEVLRPQAAALQITLLEAPFTDPSEVEPYLKAHSDIDAILLIPEPVSIIPAFYEPMFVFADSHKIPVAGVVIHEGDSGAAFSFIPNAFNVGELAAPLADKIFKGTSAGVIPIVTPESVFEINYRVIQRLGLTVSESLLSTADRVIH